MLETYRRFGEPVGTNIKTQGTPEAGTDRFSRNIGNYQSTLSDVPGDRRSNFHRDGRLKSRAVEFIKILLRTNYSEAQRLKGYYYLLLYSTNAQLYIILYYILTYLLTAIRLTPGGSSTVHIYTKTTCRTTQLTVGRLSGIRTQSGQTKINDELTA